MVPKMPTNAPRVPVTVPAIFDTPARRRYPVSTTAIRAPRRCALTVISVVQA